MAATNYGSQCCRLFFEAALAWADRDSDRFQIRVGDYLAHFDSFEKPSKIKIAPGRVDKSLVDDSRLRLNIHRDVLSGAAYSSTDRGALESQLQNRNTFLITAFPIRDELAIEIDNLLWAINSYLGLLLWSEPGTLRQDLLLRRLQHLYSFDRRSLEVIFRSSELESAEDLAAELASVKDWFSGLPFEAVVHKDKHPALDWQLSPLSLETIRSKTLALRELTEPERVIEQLILDGVPVVEGNDFPRSIGLHPLGNPIIPEAKLTHYALDPNHPKGGDKARVFKSALGIELKDWEYLRTQVL